MLDFPDRSTTHLTLELYNELIGRLRLRLATTDAHRLLDDSSLLVIPFENSSGTPLRLLHGTALLILVEQQRADRWQQPVYDLKEHLLLIGETFFQASGLPHLLLKRPHQQMVLGNRSPDRTWHFRNSLER